VRKHANSSQVKVMIRQINQKGQELIQMQVSDNGIGFKLRDSKHRFGLKTMKERAISARGTLEVRSVLGKGTSVDCSFPCIEPEPIKNGGAIFSLEGKNLHFMI
jgi:signal transduction histidine kinase